MNCGAAISYDGSLENSSAEIILIGGLKGGSNLMGGQRVGADILGS